MVHYSQVPVRPDGVRDNWNSMMAWVASLSSAEYAIWAEHGNCDDGPWTQFIPGVIQQGERMVGADVVRAIEAGDFANAHGWTSIQELHEWWKDRNPHHNLDFFVNCRPVVNPKYYIGKPKEAPDWRYDVNSFIVWRDNPPFYKLGPLYKGFRADKPPTPVPLHWVKRPEGGYGGADDRGAKSLEFKPW